MRNTQLGVVYLIANVLYLAFRMLISNWLVFNKNEITCMLVFVNEFITLVILD